MERSLAPSGTGQSIRAKNRPLLPLVWRLLLHVVMHASVHGDRRFDAARGLALGITMGAAFWLTLALGAWMLLKVGGLV